MEYYLCRFKLKDTNGKCMCSENEYEDQAHIMHRCKKAERIEARNTIERKYGNHSISLRMNGKVNGEHECKMNEWAEMVLETECMEQIESMQG